jgi:hypothetical protein
MGTSDKQFFAGDGPRAQRDGTVAGSNGATAIPDGLIGRSRRGSSDPTGAVPVDGVDVDVAASKAGATSPAMVGARSQPPSTVAARAKPKRA